jgi:hypothetical protein
MGFPTRISLDAIGPTKENYQGLTGDPRFFKNAAEINLEQWQIGGLSGTGALVRTSFTTAATTGAMVLNTSREAWNPKLVQSAPVLARTSTGLYTLTYPSQVVDEAGNSAAVSILDAEAHIQIDGDAYVVARASASNVITVTMKKRSDLSFIDLVGGLGVRILVVGR